MIERVLIFSCIITAGSALGMDTGADGLLALRPYDRVSERDALITARDLLHQKYHALWRGRINEGIQVLPSPKEGWALGALLRLYDRIGGEFPEWAERRRTRCTDPGGRGKRPENDLSEEQKEIFFDREYPVPPPEGPMMQGAMATVGRRGNTQREADEALARRLQKQEARSTVADEPVIRREPDVRSIVFCVVLGTALGVLINEAWHDYTNSESDCERAIKSRHNSERVSTKAKRLRDARS